MLQKRLVVWQTHGGRVFADRDISHKDLQRASAVVRIYTDSNGRLVVNVVKDKSKTSES
jgi:hypothetical protein